MVRRTDYLLSMLTSFRGLDALGQAIACGYIPTILPRTKRHGELTRLLRSMGITVRS